VARKHLTQIGVMVGVVASMVGIAAIVGLVGRGDGDRAQPGDGATAGATATAASGTTAGAAPAARATAQDVAGVLQNPRIAWSADARRTLTGEDVDARLLALVVALATDHRIAVAALPVVPGSPAGTPRRAVAISSVDGSPVSVYGPLEQLTGWLYAQQPPYRPADVALQWSEEPVLLVTLPPGGSSASG
jgi:hypothetical protein